MCVSQLVVSKHKVVFDADDSGKDISHIINKQTGVKIPMERVKKTYEIEVDVLPYQQAKKVQSQKQSAFRRQGEVLP